MLIRSVWKRRRPAVLVLPLLVLLAVGAPGAAAQSGASCGVSLAISPQSQRGLPGTTVTFSYRAAVTVAQIESVQVNITVDGSLPAAASPGSHALATAPLADPQTYGVEGSISAAVPANAAAGTVYELATNQAVAVCSTPNGGTLTGSSGGPALSIVVAQVDPTATSTSTAASTATVTSTPPPTATNMATPSPSPSPTATSSPTPLPTATGTATPTVTTTATGTSTSTSTAGPTATATGSFTPTPTGVVTASPSPSPTGSAIATGAPTTTATTAGEASPTASPTGSVTASTTRASTATGTVTSGAGSATEQVSATTTTTPETTGSGGQPAEGQRLELTQTTSSAPESSGGASWPRLALGFLGVGLASAGGYALWRGRQRPY